MLMKLCPPPPATASNDNEEGRPSHVKHAELRVSTSAQTERQSVNGRKGQVAGNTRAVVRFKECCDGIAIGCTRFSRPLLKPWLPSTHTRTHAKVDFKECCDDIAHGCTHSTRPPLKPWLQATHTQHATPLTTTLAPQSHHQQQQCT